jgi:hypothetical protein
MLEYPSPLSRCLSVAAAPGDLLVGGYAASISDGPIVMISGRVAGRRLAVRETGASDIAVGPDGVLWLAFEVVWRRSTELVDHPD